MSASDKLRNFISGQVEESKAESYTAKIRKEAWCQHVDILYTQIKELLNDFIEDGTVILTEHEVLITENFLGSYWINELHLMFGKNEIHFKPVGANVLGAYGRVDMLGPQKRILLILAEKGVKPGIKVQFVESSTKKDKEDTVHMPSEYEWLIVQDKINDQYISFNEDSFTDALQTVIGNVAH